MRLLAILATASVCAAAARAQDPRAVQPERPTVATHAGTVAPGYLEIEFGAEFDRQSSVNSSFVPVVLKFGIAPRVQLSILPSFLSSDAGTGPGDLAVGVKWRLLEDAPILGDFAILPAIKWPTGSVTKGTGTGTTDGSILLISSYKAGDVAIDLNAGLTTRGGNGTVAPKTATVWTASFGGPFTSKVGWVAEVFGYPGTGGPAGETGTAALLLGPTFMKYSWLSFDAGVIIPLVGTPPRALYAGGVYNVGRLW
jgi:hypothetical protein